jgi:tRNA(fMet)-specific endonuclease VapC
VKLLDTDTCIGVLRGRADVLARREAEREELATSWVSASELFFGAARSAAPVENAAAVVRLLASMRVLGLDLGSARVFGEVKATLSRNGAIVADADLWIGSIAIRLGATVVTGNRRHFERIPGIVVEDWLRA